MIKYCHFINIFKITGTLYYTKMYRTFTDTHRTGGTVWSIYRIFNDDYGIKFNNSSYILTFWVGFRTRVQYF